MRGRLGTLRATAAFESLERRVLFCALHEAPLWLDPAPLLATGSASAGATASGMPLVGYPVSGSKLTASAVPAATLPGLPALDSFPGAPAAIYLDFNGNGTNAPYSEDADAATFNAAEQANIRLAWKQMAAYYAPFNVNVTTVRPSVPMAWGLITNTLTSVGYSYINVFPNAAANGPQSFNPAADARTRQSGLAHEIGHNFGLQHQSDFDLLGNRTNEYSSGYDATHGPIMGVDYAQGIHKWFLGHSTLSPSALQDDVAVIAAKIAARPNGGDGFRPDDVGGTIATATPLAAAGGVQTATGIIERMADADAYAFTAAGGRVAVDVSPVNPSGLVPKVSVYDAAGNLVAAKDDADVRGTSNNDVSVALNLTAGTYYAVVSSHGDYGDIGQYAVTATDLPGGWSSQWVGAPSLEGSYARQDPASGTFTVAGSGGTAWGTADQEQYAYTTLAGDGTIVARVASVTNTDAFAKVGLQVRESLSEGAKQVTVNATPTSGVQFIRRPATGGNITSTNATAAAFAPVYLKLVRSGDTFTASRSADGVTYTTVGTVTIPMAANAYVGLFSYSRNGAAVNASTFDGLATAGGVNAAPPAPNALPAPAAPTVAPAAAGTGLDVTWAAVLGAAGYAVERSIDGTDFARAGTTTAGTTAYADAGLWGSMRYFYRVRALDGGGASAPSPAGTAVNRPNAPTNLAVTSWQTDRVILNWRDVSGETGYRVERSADGGATFAAVATVGVNVPSYTDAGLATATAYAYRVVPTSAQGDGPATAAAVGTTRLPATTGLAFASIAGTGMAIRWDAVPGATGYRVDRSTDGTTFVAAATFEASVTSYADAAVTPGGEYYYRVVGTNATTEGVWAAPAFAAAPAAVAPPVPWQSQDVGAPAGTGTTGFGGGTFTLVAGGVDIWGAADEGRFTSMTLVGDGTIVARVASLEDTDQWAKAGVMIRESAAAGAKRVFMCVSRSNGAQFAYRTATNGATSAPATVAGAAPYWVRLVRAGTTFTGSVSADGTTWTTAGTATVSMASQVTVGLALTSHTSTLLNTATFTNATVTTAAASVKSTAVGDGSAQRSMVGSFTVAFTRPVATFDAGAFAVTAVDGSAASFVATAAAGGLSVVLTPAGSTASFADGSYDVAVRPALIRDAAGQAASGADGAYAFHRLFGDADGDRDVDGTDSRGFRAALGSDAASAAAYNPAFDYDGDGDVDGSDSRQFRGRLGTSL